MNAYWRSLAGYPLGQWVYGVLAMLVAAGLLWAELATRFVPTPVGGAVSLAVAVGIGLMAGVFAWRSAAFRPDNPRFQTLAAKYPVYARPGTRIPGLALTAFLFTFPATECGFLDWWTSLTGEPGERMDHIADYSRYHRFSCGGFRLVEAPWVLRTAVCADLAAQARPSPGTPIRLIGRQSPFGVVVSDYRIEPATPAPDEHTDVNDHPTEYYKQ